MYKIFYSILGYSVSSALLIACTPKNATLKLTNNSTSMVDKVEIQLCGDSKVIGRMEAGEQKSISFKFQNNCQFRVSIKYLSGISVVDTVGLISSNTEASEEIFFDERHITSMVKPLNAIDTHELCSREDAFYAEEYAYSRDWQTFYSAFKKFAHCDDGGIAEGWTDSVGELLANHWNKFETVLMIIEKDTKLEAFILNHINEVTTQDQANSMENNALRNCPDKGNDFCNKILAQVRRVRIP